MIFGSLLLWNGTKMETRGGNAVVLMKSTADLSLEWWTLAWVLGSLTHYMHINPCKPH